MRCRFTQSTCIALVVFLKQGERTTCVPERWGRASAQSDVSCTNGAGGVCKSCTRCGLSVTGAAILSFFGDVQYKRRQSGKTDYRARLRLTTQDKNKCAFAWSYCTCFSSPGLLCSTGQDQLSLQLGLVHIGDSVCCIRTTGSPCDAVTCRCLCACVLQLSCYCVGYWQNLSVVLEEVMS